MNAHPSSTSGGTEPRVGTAETLAEVLASGAPPGCRWSVQLRRADAGHATGTAQATGTVLAEHEPGLLLPTASLAKVHLLIEVAAQIEAGTLDAAEMNNRREVEPVADSGLWQHLGADALSVADLAVLVGAVSDNLATNALLNRIGLAAVQARGRALAPSGSLMLDRIREVRTAQDPPAPSRGCAGDHALLMARLACGDVVSEAVSAQVLSWLALDTDTSMVAGALDLDPLAHVTPDGGLAVRHKTGTDEGVRADAGVVIGPGGTVAYAVLCSWDAASPGDPAGQDGRAAVLETMRAIGGRIADRVR